MPATIPDPDHRIINLKYAAKQIGLMTQKEVGLWGRALLLKIHVITGWVIPEGDLMNVLVDQFQKKMVESYPNVNTEEIEFAFRESGTTTKDWGKAMNLSLIDEVMIPYLNKRHRLSLEFEERKLPPEVMRVYTDKELDDLHRSDAEAFYQRLRAGKIPECIPDYIRSILKKDSLIKDGGGAESFFTDRLGRGFENIYVKA